MTSELRLPRGVLLGLGLIAASLGLSAPTLNAPPLWDDHLFVARQAFLQDPANLARVLDPRALVRVLPVRNSARPVWLASILLDRALFGASFAALRATSALWNAAGGLLLAALAWELTADAAAAGLAGLLFVVHPTHAETVAIATFRSDPLAFAFLALALLLHLRAGRAERPVLLRAGALAAFALALLSKESAAALPLLLPVVDAAVPPERRGPWARRARVYAAFGLVLLGYLWFRVPRSGYVAPGESDAFSALYARAPGLFAPVARPASLPPALAAAERPTPDARPWSRAMADRATRARTLVAVSGSDLRRLFWPEPLQGDYAPRPALSWADARVLAALAGWALLLALAAAASAERPLLAAGLAWIPAALVPTSGLVWMPNLTADRYLYVPSAGVCLAAAALAARPAGGGALARRAALALGLSCAAFWAALWVLRAPVYRSDEAYFRAVVAADPGAPRARVNLGLALWNAGRLDEAERELAAGVSLWPEGRKARRAYAELLAARGRAGEAARVLAEAP